MSRRDVLLAVLEKARSNPAGPLPFEPAAGVFADREELLLALHHRWIMLLTGRLELALSEDDQDVDPVSAVIAAWRALAKAEPVLRAVLDAHPVPRRAAAEEHRLLALWSGLAEPYEPPAEVARIGTALLAMHRESPRGRVFQPLTRATR